jgi:hypothetical protein
MRANRLHGKRMTEADHKRAIEIAIDHKLLRSEHAKDVVPEVVELVGCSVRIAQINTTAIRRAMIEKRDRHIWVKHREGRSQEAIGAELEVDQATVARVIKRVMQERNASFLHKPQRPTPPTVDWPEAIDMVEDAPEVENAPTYLPQPPKASAPPTFKIDLGQFLPLLDRLRPIDEGGDDMESGSVGRHASGGPMVCW